MFQFYDVCLIKNFKWHHHTPSSAEVFRLLCSCVSFTLFAIFYQGFCFGKSGEVLTLKLRLGAFKAMLRQVCRIGYTCVHFLHLLNPFLGSWGCWSLSGALVFISRIYITHVLLSVLSNEIWKIKKFQNSTKIKKRLYC